MKIKTKKEQKSDIIIKKREKRNNEFEFIRIQSFPEAWASHRKRRERRWGLHL